VVTLAFAVLGGSGLGGAEAIAQPATHSSGPPSSHQAADEVEAEIARTDLGSRLEAALGSSFGGVWFEPSTAQLNVGVISPAGRRVAEAVAGRAGLADELTVNTVSSTWRELEAAQAKIDDELEDLFARGDARTALAPDRNSVEIDLSSSVADSRRARVERDAKMTGVPVTLTVVPKTHLTKKAEARCKEFEEDKANCDKPIVGGVTIEGETGEICTAGPAAILQDLSTPEKATATYLLTAGHCLKELGGGVGTKWFGFTKEKGKKGEKLLIGEVEQALKGEEGAAKDRVDVGVIKINNPGNWVHEGVNKATPVTPGIVPWDPAKEVDPIVTTAQGAAKPVVGTEVCVSGQTSGTSCGKVINSSVTETFKNKAGEKWTVDKTVEVQGAVTGAGTSGAPWVLEAEPGKVLGTHIGAEGGLANFQPLAVSFENLETKLQLLTKANERRAHAHEFLSETDPTILAGNQVTVSQFAIPGTSVAANCAVARFSGTVEGAEVGAGIFSSSEVTVHPEYEGSGGAGCAVEPLGSGTVVTNGCDYVLTGETGATERAAIHIVCESGKRIEIQGPGCTIFETSQTVHGVHYTSLGSGSSRDVLVEAAVGDIAYTASGVLCGLVGIPSSGTNATYTGTITTQGFRDEGGVVGTQVGIWVE
jgi:hypothetical protein